MSDTQQPTRFGWLRALVGLKVAPSAVQNVRRISFTPTSITLAWDVPVKGTPPFRYIVFTRLQNDPTWRVGAASTTTSATVGSLLPRVPYEFEVMAYNN